MSPLSTFLLTTLLLATTLSATPIHEDQQPHPDVPSQEEQTRVFTTSTTYSTITVPSTSINVATSTGKFPPIPTSSWEHSNSAVTGSSSIEGVLATSEESTWKDHISSPPATDKPSPTESPSSSWLDHQSSSSSAESQTQEPPTGTETPEPEDPEDPETPETPETRKPEPETSCSCTAAAITVTATVTISQPSKFQTSLSFNNTKPSFKGTGIPTPLTTLKPIYQNSTSILEGPGAPDPTFTPGVVPGFVPGKIYPVPSLGPQKPGEGVESSSASGYMTQTSTAKSTVASATSITSASVAAVPSSSVYSEEIERDY